MVEKTKRFTALTLTVDGHEAPSTVGGEEEAETRRRSRNTTMAAMAWEAKREVHLGGPRRFTKTITTRMKKMQKLKKMQKNEEAQMSEDEEARGVGEREARVIFFKKMLRG